MSNRKMNMHRKRLPKYSISVGNRDISVYVAHSFFDRLLGIHRFKLTPVEALLFPRCSYIHTFGCPVLGVILLDDDNRLVRDAVILPPYRIFGSSQASSVLEFPPSSPLAELKIGERIFFRQKS